MALAPLLTVVLALDYSLRHNIVPAYPAYESIYP